MTYNVFGGTLSLTQSIKSSAAFSLSLQHSSYQACPHISEIRYNIQRDYWKTVVSLAAGGSGPPRVTPSRGVTPKGKKMWLNLTRKAEKRGRTGKQGAGDTLQGLTPE